MGTKRYVMCRRGRDDMEDIILAKSIFNDL